MTTALHLLPRRRVLVLIGASVMLHYLAIDWAGAQLAAPMERAEPVAEPLAIVASLHAPPVQAMAAAQLAAPAAQRARPALPRPAPAAPPAPASSVPEASNSQSDVSAAGAEDAEDAVAPVAALEAVTEAPAAAPAADPAAGPAADPIAAPDAGIDPGAAPEPAPVPRYKVDLPPAAELTLDVDRTDAKGANWSGQAIMDWRRSGDAYRMSVVASITVLVTIKLVELSSEGVVGPDGIVPRVMLEKRRNRAQTATHFSQEQDRITFSASSGSHQLVPGVQDKATFPMQLAGIGRADAAQFASGVELLVGEERDANVFRFVVMGQEEIDTAMGKLATWRLMRAPRPGSYSSRLDVWLAPGQNWYPVQIRSTEANGAVTTQTIRKIVVKESGT